MRKQSIILYALGFLMIAVMALVVALTVSVMDVQSVSGEPSAEKPRLDLPDDIPWDKIPWREFPENFPWDEVPWEDMPENTDWENVPWESVPWEKLPDDIPAELPWEEIPWEELPEDFPYDTFDWQGFPWSDVTVNEIPWSEIPWNDIPAGFPWSDVPLDQIQWSEVPWEDMPENTDWENVPWESIPWEKLSDDIPAELPWEEIPWEELPEDFPYDTFDWQGFPWADVTVNEIPWSVIPWDDVPAGFPWSEVPLNSIPWSVIPWNDIPAGFPWSEVPWAELPEEFPWELVPWTNLPPDFPWTEFEGGECPHKYIGGANGDGWIAVEPATCSTDGEEMRICLLCRASETRSVTATGVHDFQNEICTMCSRRHIVLKSGSATAQYGGGPLKEESCTVESGELIHGHSVRGEYAQMANVGISDNVFTATVSDEYGGDVSDSYVIDYIYGVLELTRRDVTVTTGSASKVYDGSALTCDDFTEIGLAVGDHIELTFSGRQTVRGESQNTATVKIFDRQGADVTANYSIKIIFGTLTVE